MSSVNNRIQLELIDKALNGDEFAYSKLWELNIKNLYLYIYNKIGNSSASEEISNEVLAKTLLKLNTFNKDYSFSSWLKKIADNACIDYLRKMSLSRNSQMASIYDIEIVDNDNEEKKIIREEKMNLYILAFNKLTSQQKKVLELRYFHELSYGEIATNMNISLSSVKVLIHRAKQNYSMQIKYKKI